jgi:IS5 family transposase
MRIIADRGHRRHGAPAPYDLRVYVCEQRRGVTKAVAREFERHAPVEPVIGHMKAEHRMDRNDLWHSTGDATNAVLAAVGYDFARLLARLRELLCALPRLYLLAASGGREPVAAGCRATSRTIL